MHSVRKSPTRSVNPLLNLFWFFLLLPVVLILRLLFLNKLPWLEGKDPFGR